MYNSIYPAYANSYFGIQNKPITRKSDEEKSNRPDRSAEKNQSATERGAKQNQNISYFPNGEKVATDYTKKQIQIDNVFRDFHNTVNAIGTPDDIRGEVDAYLSLAKVQSQKETPNKQIISSNLKNAAQILDDYITKTLKKPSKVVETWVDTLFMQKLDLKSAQTPEEQAPEEVIEIESAEKTSAEEETEAREQPETAHPDFYIPENAELKRLFINAKKYAAINENEKALYAFQTAGDYALETGDDKVFAMTCYEQGKILADMEEYEEALYNCNLAVKKSADKNIKAKAHLSMGEIYDKNVQFDPAADHYCAAASYAGEADNVKLQATVFSKLANLHTQMYDKENAVIFMDLSSADAEISGDEKVKGFIYGKNAKMCEKLDDNAAALSYYGKSSKSFSIIDDKANAINNYIAASDIMLLYGNTAKARTLLQKAYLLAKDTGNTAIKEEINSKLAAI